MALPNLFTITDKEQRVLRLASKHETNNGEDYDAVINNITYRGKLTSMTLAQVRELQLNELSGTSGAVGRYQLITLFYPNFVGDAKYAGFSDAEQRRLKFTPDIQDYIILKIMKADYKLDEWLNESISSEEFQFQMSRLFASVGVPYDVKRGSVRQIADVIIPIKDVKKGESLYSGISGNNTPGDTTKDKSENAEAFLVELEAIRQGVDSVAKTVDTSTSSINGADPEQGTSPKRIAEYATAGGNRPTGGHKTVSNPNMTIILPDPVDVYKDEPIDAHDNRYDFRTGRMIRDIGINGTAPVSSNPQYTTRIVQSPGVASGPDAGEAVPVPEQPVNTITQNQVGYGEGQIDPRLASAANLNVVPSPVSLPIGTTGSRSTLPLTDPNRTGPQ